MGVLLVLIQASASIQALEGVVVLGSFANSDNAERHRLELSEQLKTPVHIVDAIVSGVRHYRVVTDPMSKTDAQTWIAATQTQGIGGWFAPMMSAQEHTFPPAKPPTKATPAAAPAFASLHRLAEQTTTTDLSLIHI